MSVEPHGDVIRLQGRCTVDEAERLLELLSSGLNIVDLTGCEHLHGALLQLLMASRPKIIGEPSQFLQKWIVPLLNRSDSQFDGPLP